METWIVIAECANGHKGELKFIGVDRRWAEIWAGLTDGSSELYVHPPGPDCAFCKCGICGAPFKCSVHRGEDVDEQKAIEEIQAL
jgi:hypothetical protein